MLARYGGAFGTSMAMHAALAASLAVATAVPPPGPQNKANRQVEVLLLPPSEDSAFPGLKPVERSRGARLDDLDREGQIAGADIDRIGGHLLVLFPFVTPGLALDAFFPSIPSSSRLVFENPYAPKPAAREEAKGRRLAMTPAQLQALVDKSWTRAHRW